MISNSEDTVESYYDHKTHNLAHQSFHMTLHFMMMHHNTKFGYRKVEWQMDEQTDGHSDCNIAPVDFITGREGDNKTSPGKSNMRRN